MEKIISIEETIFPIKGKNFTSHYDGFIVTTDQQTIKIGISDNRQCCEDFGCMITNDETSEFIGAELLRVSLTDTTLNNKEIEVLEYLDEGGIMFVNLETTKGFLQFAAYNSHNGYYGHEAVLISKQLNETQDL